MIPFKVQFDKLTRAYIEDKVDPYMPCACFIGNLLNGKGIWVSIRKYQPFGFSELLPTCYQPYTFANEGLKFVTKVSEGTYSPKEIVILENLFLHTLEKNTVGRYMAFSESLTLAHPKYEEALFKAFCVTLDKLKEIHESKGEIVDTFTFIKRQKKEVA